MATREATSARGEAHRRRMEGAARRAARAGSAGVLGFQRVVAGRERDVAEDGPDHAVQLLVELAERVGGRERVVENAAVVGGVDLRCARTPEHAGSGYVWVLHCNAAALLQSKHCRKLVWSWRRLGQCCAWPERVGRSGSGRRTVGWHGCGSSQGRGGSAASCFVATGNVVRPSWFLFMINDTDIYRNNK